MVKRWGSFFIIFSGIFPFISNKDLDATIILTFYDYQIKQKITYVYFKLQYGDPTPPDSGFSWIPQAPNEVNQYWEISGPDPKMTTNQDIQKRMAFWERTMG